jgi:hypothetical protein
VESLLEYNESMQSALVAVEQVLRKPQVAVVAVEQVDILLVGLSSLTEQQSQSALAVLELQLLEQVLTAVHHNAEWSSQVAVQALSTQQLVAQVAVRQLQLDLHLQFLIQGHQSLEQMLLGTQQVAVQIQLVLLVFQAEAVLDLQLQQELKLHTLVVAD